MTGSMVLKLNGKDPVVGVIGGKLKTEEWEHKLRTINDFRNFNQGDELIIRFPLYEDSTDSLYSGGAPSADYVLTGFTSNNSVFVILENLQEDLIYDLEVELYYWNKKTASFELLNKGKVLLTYTSGGILTDASVNGQPGTYLFIKQIPVSRDSINDYRPYVKISNIGVGVDVRSIIKYDADYIKEVLP